MLRTSPFVQRVLAGCGPLVSEHLLASLYRVPGLLVDDPQARHFLDHPFGFGIEPRHPLSRIRVFQVAEPVPDEAADIEFVVENADAALRVAVDGRRSPLGPLRPGHTFCIQLKSNCSRRFAGEVIGEDATDGDGLRVVDRPIAADGSPFAANCLTTS
jgi:hypothetical protein